MKKISLHDFFEAPRPQIVPNAHKKLLKDTLKRRYLKARSYNKSFFYSLVHTNYMQLLKKTLPLGVLTIFALLFSLNQFSLISPPKVSAQQVIQEAIADIFKMKAKYPEMQEDLDLQLKVLQEALKSKKLEYLGEFRFTSNTNDRVRKLRFTDPSLPQDLRIHIYPDTPALAGIHFELTPEGQGKSGKNYEIISGEIKDGKITDPEALKQQLTDPKVRSTESWIKDLIHFRNKQLWREDVALSSSGNRNENEIKNELDPYLAIEHDKFFSGKAIVTDADKIKDIMSLLTPYISESDKFFDGKAVFTDNSFHILVSPFFEK